MHKHGYFRNHPLYPGWPPTTPAPCLAVPALAPRKDAIPDFLRTMDFRRRDINWGFHDGVASLSALEILVNEYDVHWVQEMVPLTKEMTVLDIGCGYGRSEEWLCQTVGTVHGVDISADIISVCRKRFQGIPNVEFFENSGNDLRMCPTASYDFIYCYNVFQHIPRDMVRAYLREYRRVLKPGGVCLFNLLSGVNHTTQDGDSYAEWALGYREQEAINMIHVAGLHLLRIHRWSVTGVEPYWLWVIAENVRGT
ncbi:MAG: class I SAM-dependent methyltransferase [Nitrospiraceae bacterium]